MKYKNIIKKTIYNKKNRKRIQKFKEAKDSRYIYQSELDKTCFQHDMAYGDFKDLTRRTASHKILHDKAFNIAKNSKYDRDQSGLTSMIYKFFDKKSPLIEDKSASGSGIKNENISNQKLVEELHKPIIKKFKKRKVHSTFVYDVWGVDLAVM